jgi:hypothetical protein
VTGTSQANNPQKVTAAGAVAPVVNEFQFAIDRINLAFSSTPSKLPTPGQDKHSNNNNNNGKKPGQPNNNKKGNKENRQQQHNKPNNSHNNSNKKQQGSGAHGSDSGSNHKRKTERVDYRSNKKFKRF